MHTMDGKRELSTSEWLLSSYALTVLALFTTGAGILMLFLNDRSVGLQIVFTVLVALQFLFLMWMFITSISVIFDALRGNDQIINAIVIFDFLFAYLIIWTNTGLLFWLWDTSESRNDSFTELSELNPFLAWVTFYYITILNVVGVGYGRYIADTLLAETWVSLLVTFNIPLIGILLSSFTAVALQNINTTEDQESQRKKRS